MIMIAVTKYVYQIRCRNGAVVDNLQINGTNQEDARRKLQQMYHHCEILEENIVANDKVSTSYEEVLNLISNNQ